MDLNVQDTVNQVVNNMQAFSSACRQHHAQLDELYDAMKRSHDARADMTSQDPANI